MNMLGCALCHRKASSAPSAQQTALNRARPPAGPYAQAPNAMALAPPAGPSGVGQVDAIAKATSSTTRSARSTGQIDPQPLTGSASAGPGHHTAPAQQMTAAHCHKRRAASPRLPIAQALPIVIGASKTTAPPQQPQACIDPQRNHPPQRPTPQNRPPMVAVPFARESPGPSKQMFLPMPWRSGRRTSGRPAYQHQRDGHQPNASVMRAPLGASRDDLIVRRP